MIDKITKLVSMGYSAKSILDSLMKKSPEAAKKIGKAIALGYAPSTILSRLFVDQRAKPEVYKTELEQYFKGQEEQKQKGLGQLATAATAIGAAGLGLGRAAGLLGSEKTTKAIPSVTEGMRQTAEKLPEEVLAKPKETVTEELKRRFEAPEEPEIKTEQPIKPAREIAKAIGETKFEKDFPHLKNFVTKHLDAGKTPEQIYGLLTKSGIYKSLVQAFEDRNKVSYMDRINEIASQMKPKKKNILEKSYERQSKLSGMEKKEQGGKELLLNSLLDKYEKDLLS